MENKKYCPVHMTRMIPKVINESINFRFEGSDEALLEKIDIENNARAKVVNDEKIVYVCPIRKCGYGDN